MVTTPITEMTPYKYSPDTHFHRGKLRLSKVRSSYTAREGLKQEANPDVSASSVPAFYHHTVLSAIPVREPGVCWLSPHFGKKH